MASFHLRALARSDARSSNRHAAHVDARLMVRAGLGLLGLHDRVAVGVLCNNKNKQARAAE
jgi:hypothetical protein